MGGIAPYDTYDTMFVIEIFLQRGSSNETCFQETRFF
jgi:hypothetical protein